MSDIIFSRKIQCYHCGKNFKSKLEKGKRKYVCQTYDNGKGCKRIIVEEDFFKDLINKRYYGSLSDEEIGNMVDYIIVEDKKLFEIHFHKEKPIIFSKNFLQL